MRSIFCKTSSVSLKLNFVRDQSLPIVMASSSAIDVLSRPLTAHSDAQGTFWRQAETPKGLMYLQSKAVRSSFRRLEQMR